MAKPEYVNNFQIFMSKGDNVDGETIIQFNHMYRKQIIAQIQGTPDVRVMNESAFGADEVCSVVMSKESAKLLHSILGNLVAQFDMDDKINDITNGINNSDEDTQE